MLGQALLQSFIGSTSQQGGAIVDTNVAPTESDPINYTPLYMIGALSFLAVFFIIFKSSK